MALSSFRYGVRDKSLLPVTMIISGKTMGSIALIFQGFFLSRANYAEEFKRYYVTRLPRAFLLQLFAGLALVRPVGTVATPVQG